MRLFNRDGTLQRLTDNIDRLSQEVAALRGERRGLAEATQLQSTINDLRTEVNKLKIDKSKIEEGHAREERELRHMIGLEKKRQEFETESAKRDARLGVREENLAAERIQFESQMKFRVERFDGEVAYLKSLMEQLLKRLPTVDVNVVRGDKPTEE